MDKFIIKGGGVIVRNGEDEKEILLVKTSKRGFSFPKGHLEENELIEECALRECKEETGLDLKIIKELPSMKSTDWKDPSKHFLDHYFLMEVIGGELTKEHEKDELRWVPLSKVKDTFLFEARKEYIEEIKDLI
jgi:8-oxo-dGTP diphosphatase